MLIWTAGGEIFSGLGIYMLEHIYVFLQKQEKSFATKKSRKNSARGSYRLLLVSTGPGAPVRPLAADLQQGFDQRGEFQGESCFDLQCLGDQELGPHVRMAIPPPSKASDPKNVPLRIEQARLWQIVGRKGLQATPAMSDLSTSQLRKEQSQLAVEALLMGQRRPRSFLF